jgi:hypothetical protein
MLKITYKGCFLRIKLTYAKWLYTKSKRCTHTLVLVLHLAQKYFSHKNMEISNYGDFKKIKNLNINVLCWAVRVNG